MAAILYMFVEDAFWEDMLKFFLSFVFSFPPRPGECNDQNLKERPGHGDIAIDIIVPSPRMLTPRERRYRVRCVPASLGRVLLHRNNDSTLVR